MHKKSDFEPYLNLDIKMISNSGDLLEMKLVDIQDLPKPVNPPGGVRRDPFVLIFRRAKDAVDIGNLLECVLGEDPPFLLSVQPEAEVEGQIQYNSVFN